MKILRNKFFLIGNLVFLIIAIPVVLYLVKNQTTTRSGAAPTSTLSFSPGTINTDECAAASQTNLVLNPGQNLVGSVQISLKWDKSKFSMNFTPNSGAFPQTFAGPTETADGYQITLNIGSDVTKAISSTTNVGTLTITPNEPGNVNLTIDAAGTAIYSLAQPQDGPTENVYNAAGSSPLAVNISACGGNPSPSVTTTVSPTSSPQPQPTATNTPTPTRTPTPTTPPAATATSAPSNNSSNNNSSNNSSSTTNSSSSTATNNTPTPTKKALAQANKGSVSPTIAEPGLVEPTFVVVAVIALIFAAGIFLIAL